MNVCRSNLIKLSPICMKKREIQYSTQSVSHAPLTLLSPDEMLMKDAVAKFAKEEVLPRVRKMDEQGKFDSELVQKLFDNGLMGIETSPQLGGLGSNFMSTILAIEELAKVDGGISLLVDIHNTLFNSFVMKVGSKEQKEKYLPMLAQKCVGSFCLSETTSGSDAFSLKTNAKRDGNDFVLNGTKMWISNADIAGLFVVFANADPSAGYKGITTFVVERDTPGLSIAKPESKLGLRASGTCAVNFDNVRVPESNILGELGKGYKYAAAFLNEGRIGIGAQMIGISQGALDATIPYALERQQFDNDIFSFQSMQHQIAQVATELECARLMVYNAARLVETKQEFLKEAAMAKLVASETAQRVTAKCIDFMGGVGFMTSFPQEKFFRDCKVGTIYEGTSNIQLNTIAKAIRKAYS